jgi:putative ABC transport system substrate-binding protein
MTTRREVLGLALSMLLPAMARAQAARKPLRVAWFSGGTPEDQKAYVEAFLGGMRALGYAEGRDFQMQYFWRGNTIKPFGWLAKDIADSKPDIVMATCEVTVAAMQKVTRTIPIVMTASTDPVASGVVESLGRPGGNVTGIASSLVEVSVKRIGLVKELVPAADRVALLRWRYEIVSEREMSTITDAARRLGMAARYFEADDADDFRRAFGEIQKERYSAVVDLAGLAISFPFMKLLPELGLRHKVPTVHFIHEMVENGGLVSYGPSVTEGFRHSASYVDKLARGARPSELPVEQPAQIELWLNQASARQLGVKLPDSLLLRADRVIE